ncbi:glutathione S-transferase [Aestuariibacter halophilus]|uniref:Glutathione S-transferase n=1 Tax=Fluctibacter halophilus TaxID=226011 RepID=A0ABS8GAA2_9ALTE|nr:glutathione S-transferase [Aestuariibacter halophilus]MCC2617453.1 glutathione S-transferase [Aestuariibacter halophilus]
MILYGSTTSPYVRRIRMFLADTAHEFVDWQIFAGDRKQLADKNPTLKIPMLEADGQVIFDSRQIHRFLSESFQHSRLTWDQENTLSVIDAANDSLVQLLILTRSGFDINDDVLYFNIQRERVEGILVHLEQCVQEGQFSKWDYLAISLFCLLDWIAFRALWDLSGYPALNGFLQRHQNNDWAQKTDPRR